MSTRKTSSFCIKSTSVFVNPSSTTSGIYHSSSSTTNPRSYTNSDTDRKQGSKQGIAIRTTNSAEDFC